MPTVGQPALAAQSAAVHYERHRPEQTTALGTDGFGRSDTRAALRSFFEVECHQIVLAALTSLAQRGELELSACAMAIERYGIATEHDAPLTCRATVAARPRLLLQDQFTPAG